MVRLLLFGLLAAFLSCALSLRTQEYGVGFSLSLDYGVASVFFANGSVANIAKVGGGPSYKQMMGHATGDRPAECIIPRHRQHVSTQTSLHQQSLRDYLPPWLGGRRRDENTIALARMLEALKTTTESYLETPVSTVEAVFPVTVTEHYRQMLRSAAKSVSLTMPVYLSSSAGLLAVLAANGQDECQEIRDKPEQMVLTVDFSRAALTALLIDEDCGIFECERILHNTSWGTDSLSVGSSLTRDEIVHSLQQLIDLPLEDNNGEGLEYINQLVMMGESANDARLHSIVKEVLEDQYSALSHSERKVDPLFAASQGAAEYCLLRFGYQPSITDPRPEM